MSLRRSNSQDLHYAQQITVLNPPTRAEHASLASEHLPKAAVAQALGLLEPGKAWPPQSRPHRRHRRQRTSSSRPPPGSGWPADDPMLAPLIEKARRTRDTSAPWLARVDALGLDDERLELVGEECLQLALALDADPFPLGMKETEPPERHPGIDRVAAQLSGPFGISSATVLRRLPIASVVAGYTRMGARQPSRTGGGSSSQSASGSSPP